MQAGPEPSHKEEGADEKKPFWSLEGHFNWRRRVFTAACNLAVAGNGFRVGRMLLFVSRAILGKVPREEEGKQDDHCPEAPEVVFPGGPFHRITA